MGSGFCGVLAVRASKVPGLRRPASGAFAAGLVLVTASRSLPLYLAGPAVLARNGRVNSEGTKGKTGGRFYASTIKAILGNPALPGHNEPSAAA